MNSETAFEMIKTARAALLHSEADLVARASTLCGELESVHSEVEDAGYEGEGDSADGVRWLACERDELACRVDELNSVKELASEVLSQRSEALGLICDLRASLSKVRGRVKLFGEQLDAIRAEVPGETGSTLDMVRKVREQRDELASRAALQASGRSEVDVIHIKELNSGRLRIAQALGCVCHNDAPVDIDVLVERAQLLNRHERAVGESWR